MPPPAGIHHPLRMNCVHVFIKAPACVTESDEDKKGKHNHICYNIFISA